VTLPTPTVLVSHHDAQARARICQALDAYPYRIVAAGTVRETVRKARAHRPHVILLDRALADMEILAVIAELHKGSGASLLVLSSPAYGHERIRALEAGADDYFTEALESAELLARVRVALRRVGVSEDVAAGSVITVGDLRIDLSRHLVFVKDAEVHLTPREYRLFAVLMKNAGGVVPQTQLLRDVWGTERTDQVEYLHVYVNHLRHKLEEDPGRPRYLVTEQAVGYRIRVD
jgi:two-component system KDP operon response regulator KdpE